MRRAQKISLAYDCWFRQKKESVFVARAFLSASKDVCLRAVGLKWDLGSRQKRAHLKDAINCEFNVPEIANRLWVCYRLEEERAWEVSQAYSDAYQNSLPYRSFTTAKKAVGAVVDGVRSALHPNIFRQQMEGERGNEGSKQAMIGVCSPAPYCEWPTPSAHPM
ncbi:MAG: hypothetical protein P4M13_10255 [Alphaproteobacteria bacterium]|nr:hypothetical protein [Alphaproteobacteria bacterium]